VTLTVRLENNGSTQATNIFVDVLIPEPYGLFHNQTGTWDEAARTVSFWVAQVPSEEAREYQIVVRVDPEYEGEEDVAFTADMVYDQDGAVGLTGSAQTVVRTGSLGDGELQLSTNAPSPPEWLWIRVNMGRPGDVTLRIYNSAGELVRVILDKYAGSEREVILRYWDGKNQAGDTVAAGVYILHAIMPHTTKIAKILVLH
jgi:hypothetical protein